MSSDRVSSQRTDWLESIRRLGQFVSMRHPHLKVLWHAIEKDRVTTLDSVDDGLSILVLESWSDGTSKDMGQFLHTVANTQDRNIAFFDQLPNFRADVWGAFVVDTGGTTTQNDGNQFMFGQVFGLDKTRVQLAIHVQFSDTTGNQVRVLRTKVKDGNLRAAQQRSKGYRSK